MPVKSQAEAVQDDSQTQYLLRAELYARHPGLRKIVPQRIGIEHTQHDAHNQRTEGKPLYKFEIRDVKRRTRKKRYQQHPMQHALSCLRCHIHMFKRAAKIVKLCKLQSPSTSFRNFFQKRSRRPERSCGVTSINQKTEPRKPGSNFRGHFRHLKFSVENSADYKIIFLIILSYSHSLQIRQG